MISVGLKDEGSENAVDFSDSTLLQTLVLYWTIFFFSGRVTTNKTKLDTIETNVDVTDTTNVTRQVLMDSEVTIYLCKRFDFRYFQWKCFDFNKNVADNDLKIDGTSVGRTQQVKVIWILKMVLPLTNRERHQRFRILWYF